MLSFCVCIYRCSLGYPNAITSRDVLNNFTCTVSFRTHDEAAAALEVLKKKSREAALRIKDAVSQATLEMAEKEGISLEMANVIAPRWKPFRAGWPQPTAPRPSQTRRERMALERRAKKEKARPSRGDHILLPQAQLAQHVHAPPFSPSRLALEPTPTMPRPNVTASFPTAQLSTGGWNQVENAAFPMQTPSIFGFNSSNIWTPPERSFDPLLNSQLQQLSLAPAKIPVLPAAPLQSENRQPPQQPQQLQISQSQKSQSQSATRQPTWAELASRNADVRQHIVA